MRLGFALLRHSLPSFLFLTVPLIRGAGIEAQMSLVEPATVSSSRTRAEEHSRQGENYLRSGNLTQAEIEFRRAVRLAPTQSAYLAQLASVLGMQRKLEESNRYFSLALKLDPGNSAARRNLAANQWQMGLLQQARSNLETALKINPHDPQIEVLLGLVAASAQDYRTAIRWLEKAPDQVKPDPETFAVLLRCYYKVGEREKAGTILRNLPSRADFLQIRFLGGRVAAEADDLDLAEALLASVAADYPDPVQVSYNRAYVRFRAGRTEESQKILLDLIDAGKETAEIWDLLGWSQRKLNRPAEAIQAFQQAIQRFPESETNYLDLAGIYFDRKQWSEALETLRSGLERIPRSSALYLLKGKVEVSVGLAQKAIESNRKALELNPAATGAIVGLALALATTSRIHEAVATFDKGIKEFPGDAVLHQEYGKMLLLPLVMSAVPASESKAFALLEKSTVLDGSLAEPHYQLGLLALRKGNLDQALVRLQAASRLDEKSSKIRFSLAESYRRWGKREEFARELEIYQRLKAEEEKTGAILTPQ